MKKRIFVVLFLCFVFLSFSQQYNKAWKQFESKLNNDDALKEEAILGFMKKHESDLSTHLADRSKLNNRLGVMSEEKQYYLNAQKYYVASFNDAYAAGDTLRWSLAQFNLSCLYSRIGYYTQAEEMFRQALPLLARYFGQSSFEYTRMFRKLVHLYVDMGRYYDAKPMNDALIYYFKTMKGEKDDEYLACLNSDAQILMGMGDYEKSIEVFNKLLQVHTSINPVDTADYITILNNTAEAYRVSGDYVNALSLLSKSLELSAVYSNSDKIMLATIYNNSGLCYKATDDYKKSEWCYNNSIKIYKELELTYHPDYTNALNNKAELYRNLGRYKQALDYLQEVVDIRRKTLGTKHVNYANTLVNLSYLFSDNENYEEAEPYLLQAKEIYKEMLGEEHQFYANCLSSLSGIYVHLKKYKEAEEYSNRALEIIKKTVGENHERYAYFLAGTVTLYLNLQKYDKAISNLEISNAVFKKKFGEKHVAYIDGVYSLASVNWRLKNYKKAQDLFFQSLNTYKNQFDDFFYAMSEREQLDFYFVVGNRFETFNSFVTDYVNQFPKENHNRLLITAFNYQLFIKSLLLNNNIASRRELLSSKDTVLINLYNRWVYHKQVLLSRYRGENDDVAEQAVSEIETETNLLEQQLKNKTNLFSQNKTFTLSDIKNKLKDKEAAVNIIRVQKSFSDTTMEYAAFILKKNTDVPVFQKILNSDKFDADFIKTYSDNIENKKEDKLSYNRFWKQVALQLSGVSKVYLSPDGVYGQINLYTLQNPVTGKYVLDEVSLSVLPNLTYVLNNNSEAAEKNAELFGYPDYEYDFSKNKSSEPTEHLLAMNRFGFTELPPLPGTKTEVENISSALQGSKWNVKVSIREQASETRLKQVNSPKVLHIATHGFFLKDIDENEDKSILGFDALKIKQNPLLRSGIMLAGASVVARDTLSSLFEQDGIFTAYEASLLNLSNTDLVVLSACETGLGVDINNQGVFGLQRAFYIAGAKNLIMSLWVVDDEATQILMSAFYKEWAKNPFRETIPSAFKKAQLEVRQKYPHPYYWGAFVLLGN